LLVSRRRFAKIIGRSHTFVNEKVNDGTITLYDGKVKVEEAKQAILDNQDPTRDAQREANEAKRRVDKNTLPFDRKAEYKTIADMTDDEKAELEREREEAEKIRVEAAAKGIDTTKEKIPKNLNQVKLFKEFYLGKMAQLDYNIKTGKYSLNEEIEKNAYELGRKVRDAVMNVPERMSSIIATMDDEIQIRELLVEELIYALEGVQS